MWHLIAVGVSFSAAAWAFLRVGKISDVSSAGHSVLAFFAALAFMEALELFWFVAINKNLFSKVQSHYDKIVFAVALLILITLIVAGFAIYDAAPVEPGSENQTLQSSEQPH
jgi:hypothetical protein